MSELHLPTTSPESSTGCCPDLGHGSVRLDACGDAYTRGWPAPVVARVLLEGGDRLAYLTHACALWATPTSVLVAVSWWHARRAHPADLNVLSDHVGYWSTSAGSRFVTSTLISNQPFSHITPKFARRYRQAQLFRGTGQHLIEARRITGTGWPWVLDSELPGAWDSTPVSRLRTQQVILAHSLSSPWGGQTRAGGGREWSSAGVGIAFEGGLGAPAQPSLHWA